MHTHLRESLGLPSDGSPFPCQTASARRPMGIVLQRQNLTANLSNAQNWTRQSPTPSAAQGDATATALVHAHAAAAYIPFLSVESLLPPKMPTKEEMEGVLLELRKRARWSMSILETSFSSCTTVNVILSHSNRCQTKK